MTAAAPKRGPGRPRRVEGETTVDLHVRLTPSEVEAVEASAEAAGVHRSDYVRWCVLSRGVALDSLIGERIGRHNLAIGELRKRHRAAGSETEDGVKTGIAIAIERRRRDEAVRIRKMALDLKP